MRVSHITDYLAKTNAFFTHCALSANLQRLVDGNRDLLANIASRAGNDIASQAIVESRRQIYGGAVDRLV
ncbi:MAG: hypothetical protein M0Z90_10835 [Desulfobacteraceae bacterium]|nr:hypothetical protein [Desulfobacteraceae bacterium]